MHYQYHWIDDTATTMDQEEEMQYTPLEHRGTPTHTKCGGGWMDESEDPRRTPG